MATIQEDCCNFKSPLKMAISNELSSDVAIAILEKNRSPQELKQLKDIILQVHSALQKMSEATHADRLKRIQPQKRQKTANGI